MTIRSIVTDVDLQYIFDYLILSQCSLYPYPNTHKLFENVCPTNKVVASISRFDSIQSLTMTVATEYLLGIAEAALMH